MVLSSESGNRRSNVATTSRHRTSSRARVFKASASRNPPPASAGPVSRSASTRTSSPWLGGTGMPSTSPSECAWSVDTTSTRCPALAALTAVAQARVDFPTPPLPTNRLIRAGVGSAVSLSLDSFLQILQRGVGQTPLGLALEQAYHRHGQVDGEFVGDFGAGALGRQPV